MVNILKRIFILLFTLYIFKASATVENLEQGILFYKQGDLEKGSELFRKIQFGDKINWTKKVIFLMNYNYHKSNYNEVWRSHQILERTQRSNHESLRLALLAEYSAKVCPFQNYKDIFTSDPIGEDFKNLLFASVFRNYRKFITPDYQVGDTFEKWFQDGVLVSSLSQFSDLYLRDIPNSKLISGSNCRNLFDTHIGDQLYSQNKEFEYLILFLQNKNSPFYKPEILARGFELSQQLKIANPILEERLNDLSVDSFKNIKEPERRFLWNLKVSKNQISEELKNKTILDIVKNAKTVEDIEWIALVDLKKTDIDLKLKLLELLNSFDKYQKNTDVLYELCYTYWKKNNLQKTLFYLRLLLNEGGNNQLTNFAAQIFTEIKWDDTSLGAFAASIPKSLWLKFNLDLLKKYAFNGNRKEFYSVLKRIPKNHYFFKELNLYVSVLERNANKLKKELNSKNNFSNNRLKQSAINFINDYAKVQLQLSQADFQNLKSINQIIILKLKSLLNKASDSENENIQQLIFTFTNSLDDNWIKGNSAVRNGILKLGQLDLKTLKSSNGNLNIPFEYPTQLPYREFYIRPLENNYEIWDNWDNY